MPLVTAGAGRTCPLTRSRTRSLPSVSRKRRDRYVRTGSPGRRITPLTSVPWPTAVRQTNTSPVGTICSRTIRDGRVLELPPERDERDEREEPVLVPCRDRSVVCVVAGGAGSTAEGGCSSSVLSPRKYRATSSAAITARTAAQRGTPPEERRRR